VTSRTKRSGTSRGSSWYGISETSCAPGDPMTAANRPLSSPRKYRWCAASQPEYGVMSPAGHMRRRRGRNDAVMRIGNVVCTSSSTIAPGSSRGTKIVSRTVNAACEYVNVVASGLTSMVLITSRPAMSSGYPCNANDSANSSSTFKG
jgi:hypothetical protein